jgi:MoaA/NifB/PqqE/SkfB family radical SAM enzyme
MNRLPQLPMSDSKPVVQEEAAHEKRNWIRLTSQCNNKCTFCLDTLAHNGTMGSEEEIKERIVEGRRNGATRLILSGGEPTIHPHYIKFIKYGRLAGYRRVQTVTNGRMFSYPDFLNRCLDAGLQEITFSVHGHNAKVHDALVGVPGAFDEEVRGIELALEDGRPIVNIDVCLNKGNIKRLPALLERFIKLGVREFDLLHLIPFGSAWDEKHRYSLMYDIEEAAPYIRAALAMSERPDLYIWFNRFPPPYLEGYEHLIQDPYKLNDEARGRFEEYELWLTRNMPISCREPERCGRCYLEHFCGTLENTMTAVSDAAFDAYRICASSDSDRPNPSETYANTWVRAENVEQALPLINQADSEGLILEFESYSGLDAHLDGDRLAEKEVVRAIVTSPDDCDALLNGTGSFEIMVRLNHDMADYLLQSHPEGHARLALTLPNHELASTSREDDPDLRAFFDAYQATVPVENIPACLSGRPPRPRMRVLDAFMLRTEQPEYGGVTPGDTGGRGSILKSLNELSIGDPAKTRAIQEHLTKLGPLGPLKTTDVLDLFGYSKSYIRDHYYTKSLRCKSCVHDTECEGMHINHIRAHGYSILQPIVATNTHDENVPPSNPA